MIIASNRVPFGAIYVKDYDFHDIHHSREMYAAAQLRYYLGRVTIAPFEIKEYTNDNSSGIYLNTPNILNKEKLNDDDFCIETTDDNRILISGGCRGIFYGVFELLERIGCRFFSPQCEKIPTKTELEIEPINIKESPHFIYRESDYSDLIKNKKFAVQCRVNGSYHRIPDYLGGCISYVKGAHTFSDLVPMHIYKDSHPEYYSLRDGKRLNSDDEEWQLCLTNPEILPIAIENARKMLLEKPEAKILSISQNDNRNRCLCENCCKIDEEEGSPAGTLIRFANKIAEALEPEFPDHIFEILAYGYTRPASTKTKARHNVSVRLCASGTCYSHPFDECDDLSRCAVRPDGTKTRFIDDLKTWSKVCDSLKIWDYTSYFPHYLMPFPNWRVLQRNLQIMYENNARSVFEEANNSFYGGTDFNELRTYLLTKLMWNPYCDIEQYRKEFMEYYYGDAAPILDKYLNLLCDYTEKDNYHLYIQDIQRPAALSEKRIDEYMLLFDEAEKAVAGNGIILSRVQKARLSLRWVRMHWRNLDGIFDAEEINSFFTDLRAHNISRIDEWCNLERSYRALLDGRDRGVHYTTPFRYDPETNL